MDNLSSLSSNLPPSKGMNAKQLADLDESLISEFKTAACAVTKLFKLSGARTTVAKEQGYLEAIEDLLAALDKDGSLDVKAWALAKKREFVTTDDNDNRDHESNPEARSLPGDLHNVNDGTAEPNSGLNNSYEGNDEDEEPTYIERTTKMKQGKFSFTAEMPPVESERQGNGYFSFGNDEMEDDVEETLIANDNNNGTAFKRYRSRPYDKSKIRRM
ncbi:hypothetical protein TRVA0_024S00826 [Trichomonascus vanleenenianus]|uniref:uncharacterized protein n=1 Tax=Trichomonascus vanleenenianus TaxID=2268995 RepID=UPI003ECB1657